MGVGEYKYYDRKSESWDDTACKYYGNWTTRCMPMDCHLSDTHFSLLGFFREPNYDEWMEQLFKHEGDCLWDDEEYRFMQGDRDAWPQGCVNTIFRDERTNNTIRYAIKPAPYGDMDIGLYTDGGCVEEYTGSLAAEEILRTMICDGYVDGGEDDFVANWLCSTNKTYYDYNYAKYVSMEDADDHHERKGNIWSLEEYLAKWNDAFDVYSK